MYSVLVLLSLKPFDSKVCLHSSSFLLTPARLSSTSTTSSAKSIHHEMSPCISHVTLSITKSKRQGLKVDPWCSPVLIGKSSMPPSLVHTLVTTLSHMSLMRVMYFVGTL